MKDFNTRFVSKGKKRSNLDLVYADEVSFEILLGYMSEEEFNSAVQTLSVYSASFIALVDVIVGEYFAIKRRRLTISSQWQQRDRISWLERTNTN